MRSALILLATGAVSLLAVIAGGPLGPCGPSGIVGLIGLLGMLICLPLGAIILLGYGLREIMKEYQRS